MSDQFKDSPERVAQYHKDGEHLKKLFSNFRPKNPIEALRVVLLVIREEQIAHAIIDIKTNQTLSEMIKETLDCYENDRRI